MRRDAWLVCVLLTACTKGDAPETKAATAPASAVQEPAPPEPEQPQVAEAEPKTSVVPEEPTPAPARATFSPEGLQPTKTWPFYAWDNARAYAYNLHPAGPGQPLVAYNEKVGWNPNIAVDKPLTRAQADRALALATDTQGEMIVSKCAYPRHAVVLFAGEVPVGSINVCFECGDILVWPAWRRDPDWPMKKENMYPKLRKVYDRVMADWKRLFADELGISDAWQEIEAP